MSQISTRKAADSCVISQVPVDEDMRNVSRLTSVMRARKITGQDAQVYAAESKKAGMFTSFPASRIETLNTNNEQVENLPEPLSISQILANGSSETALLFLTGSAQKYCRNCRGKRQK